MIIRNSNIRRSLTENRYKILVCIIAIILILLLIQVLDKMAEEKNKAIQNEESKNQGSIYTPQETVISGDNISEERQESNSELLNIFISYCNKKDIESAYNLLSSNCKEKLFYSNIQNFKNNYIDKIFTNEKICSMQSWIRGMGDTYKVKITDDMLKTGKAGQTIEDYYTIVKENDTYK